MMSYRQANRPDLAAKETDWLKQYAVAHPAPGGPNGMPGIPGMPGAPGGASVNGAGAPAGRPAGSIHVMPTAAPKPPTQ